MSAFCRCVQLTNKLPASKESHIVSLRPICSNVKQTRDHILIIHSTIILFVFHVHQMDMIKGFCRPLQCSQYTFCVRSTISPHLTAVSLPSDTALHLFVAYFFFSKVYPYFTRPPSVYVKAPASTIRKQALRRTCNDWR